MYTKLQTAVLILGVAVVACRSAYGWNHPPQASLEAVPEYAAVDENVTLDGSASYDPEEDICIYEWDFDYNGVSFDCDYWETDACYPDGNFDGITENAYSNTGAYTVMLKVKDTETATDTDTCIVYVFQRYYVSKDGNDDSNGLSWPTAFATIQRGLNEANDCEFIDVNEGTYYEAIDFNGISCTLRSTNPTDWSVVAATIIDANGASNTAVTITNSEDVNCLLRGFTITGGARGIYCDGASPTICNCVITDNNNSSGNGGGIYDCNSSPTITNCFIVGNDANLGGGIYNSSSFPALTNCVISDNTARTHGGGIYARESSTSLTNCTFSKNDANNYGGGIYNYDSAAVLTNCLIWGNTASDANSIYYNDINYPSDQNFISWWKFDETDGNIAYDSVGDNNGTLNGDANWVAGIIDGALSFDGYVDYVDCGTGPAITGTGTFTSSAWVKTDIVKAHCVLVQRSTSSPTGSYGVSVLSDGKVKFHIYNGGYGFAFTTPDVTVNDGLWHHIAAVRTSSTDGEIYVDGRLAGSGSGPAKSLNNVPVWIGRGFTGPFDFGGRIDDVRIYNRALNADEILALAGCVRYSDIEGCGGSDNWDPNFGIDGGGNIDSDPCFVDAADPDGNDGIFGTLDDGLQLAADSDCVDAADGDTAPSTDMLGYGRFDIAGADNSDSGEPNYADIGAYEVVGRVHNITKDLYYTTIQSALDDASNGDYVKAYPYTYYETIDFNGVSCTLASTDPNDPNVVASTIIDANDASAGIYVVTFNSGEDANSILEGITITGGWIGINYSNSSLPSVTKCRIINNSLYGIYTTGSPEISDCTIWNNGSRGIYLSGGSPTVSGCRIIKNGSHGVYSASSCEATLRNCVIAENSDYGVYTHDDGSSSTIVNCTIVGNNTYGILGDCDEITNCIIWNNDDDIASSCTPTYSCIEDMNDGFGNIHAYPMFADGDGNDYYLDANSRCIDAGAPWSEYSQEPAPNGSRINLGAYGNTSKATTTTDTDADGISDAWERYFWPSDEPNQHDPNEDLDGDNFSNWSEYLFGYEADFNDANEPMWIPHVVLSASQIDPTQKETLIISYWLTMDANVTISFTNTDTNETVQVLEEVATSFANDANWNGKDSSVLIVEDGFYEIVIDANDGAGHDANSEPISVEVYYVHDINNLRCNPYRILPLNNEISKITYDLTTDANMVVTVYDPCGVLFATLVDDELQTEDSQELVWYGRDKDPSDPNSRYISKEGAYLIRVRFVGMREKEEDTITAYK